MNAITTICDLPPDLINYLALFLDRKSIIVTCLTCRLFRCNLYHKIKDYKFIKIVQNKCKKKKLNTNFICLYFDPLTSKLNRIQYAKGIIRLYNDNGLSEFLDLFYIENRSDGIHKYKLECFLDNDDECSAQIYKDDIKLMKRKH